jgi:hypothetical protein
LLPFHEEDVVALVFETGEPLRYNGELLVGQKEGLIDYYCDNSRQRRSCCLSNDQLLLMSELGQNVEKMPLLLMNDRE